jgi:hypothetical protein
MRTPVQRYAITVVVLAATALTAYGQARSGREVEFGKPPYYRTFQKNITVSRESTVHVPIRPYHGILNPAMNNPDALEYMAEKMNQYLDGAGLNTGFKGPALTNNHWPETYFGDEGLTDFGEAAHSGNRKTALYITEPSKQWKNDVERVLDTANAEHVLIINLIITELHMRSDWRGRKQVPLGTGYTLKQPWLSDLDTALGVVALSGAVYDRKGKLIRAGVEGIAAAKPQFWQNALLKTFLKGKFSEVGDVDDPYAVLHEYRRTDLPGEPPAWQIALHNLVAQLIQDEESLIVPE